MYLNLIIPTKLLKSFIFTIIINLISKNNKNKIVLKQK